MPKRVLKPVYRRPLQELHDENHGELPSVLKESVEVLRQRGLDVRGLFSGCAEHRKVQLLIKAWNQGHNPLRLANIADCYAVAESLMEWLRALPSPIIPCRLFRSFLQARQASCQAEMLSELHLLFQQMEECELQALVQLLGLLHDYVLAQRPCFIGPSLGQLFGPLVLRGSEGPLPLPYPEDVRASAELVEYMISDYSTVFSLQSPCSSPCHKPPSRARNVSGLKRDLANAKLNKPRHLNGMKSGAHVPANENWPVKHLRVNVVAPVKDAEVCCLNPAFSGSPIERAPQHDLIVPDSYFSVEEHSKNESARLATVPEGRPLTSGATPQEPELDDLVGKLLCGSMESMLFEKNDDLFVARTSSLMSVSSATTPRNYSSCGESTDMSSDDETLHDSACSTPRKTATAWLFGLDTGCSDLRSQAGS